MGNPASSTGPNSAPDHRLKPDLSDYPVRDYIGAMAVELAQMARFDGDEGLAQALEAAAALASEPAPSRSGRKTD